MLAPTVFIGSRIKIIGASLPDSPLQFGSHPRLFKAKIYNL